MNLASSWAFDRKLPKLAPVALAAAIVRGLRDGVEDIYPGDVAQDFWRRWRDSAKVLERELADS